MAAISGARIDVRTVPDAGVARLAMAAAVLVGSFFMGLGTGWDIHWHATLGRDTFWSPPHLVLYGGAMITFASVLLGLLAERGRADRPAGAVVVGVGALWFFASGPFDELWHRLYGLDVTIWSPPHLSLIAAAWTIVLGALLILAAERRRLDRLSPERSRTRRGMEQALIVAGLGFLLHPPTIALLTAVRYSYREPGPLGGWLLPALIALVAPVALFAAPTLLGRSFGVAVPALVQLALRPVGAGFMALGYGLVFPDGLPLGGSYLGLTAEWTVRAMTVVPLLIMPPALLADAVLVALRGWRGAWVAAAALFGAVVALEGVVAPTFFGLPRLAPEALLAAMPALAATAVAPAWLGRRLARLVAG